MHDHHSQCTVVDAKASTPILLSYQEYRGQEKTNTQPYQSLLSHVSDRLLDFIFLEVRVSIGVDVDHLRS